MNETNIDNKNDPDSVFELNMITIKTEIPENPSHSSRQSLSASLDEKNDRLQEEMLPQKIASSDKLRSGIEKRSKKNKKITKISFSKQKQLLQTLQKQKVAEILFIPYIPKEAKEYFLCNDIYIEFDLSLNEEEAFEKYKQLQNVLRPITHVKYLKESGFLVLEFDQTRRGINEFSFIIPQLKTMQNNDLLGLANSLDMYNSHMQISKQLECQISPEQRLLQIERNKAEFQDFITKTVPDILKQLDPTKFFLFAIYEMTEGFHNQTRKQYGMNEKYIQLFGSNVETLTSLQLHEGWFNLLQSNFRNRQSVEYFLNIKALYESHFDFSTVRFYMDYMMVTLDNIRVPVTVKPGHHYCFSSVDKEPLFHKEPLLIGLLHVMEIQLTAEAKKIIRDTRLGRQQKSLQQQQQQHQQFNVVETNGLVTSPCLSHLAIQGSPNINQAIPHLLPKIQPLVLTTTTTTVSCGVGDAKKEEEDNEQKNNNNNITSQNNMISASNDDVSFITCQFANL